MKSAIIFHIVSLCAVLDTGVDLFQGKVAMLTEMFQKGSTEQAPTFVVSLRVLVNIF